MRRFAVMTTAFVVLAGLTAAAQGPDPAKVAAGKTAYETQKCATCHMIADKGGKLASKLDGVGGRLKEPDLRKWLMATEEMEAKLATKPKVSMSAFMKTHKLTDADVTAIVAYMLSLK